MAKLIVYYSRADENYFGDSMRYVEEGNTAKVARMLSEIIGADTLGYLPVSELCGLIGNSGYCSACFNGNYPTAIPKDTRKNRFEQKLSEVRK